MKQHAKSPITLLRRLAQSRDGGITIEFAFAVSALSILVVGIVNMGLAYAEQMSVSNAVRAGSQFALVRHPSLGPNANTQQAIVSMQDIRNAVVQSAGFLATDPGTPNLTVCVFYQCPGDPPTACSATPGSAPACTEWQTFVAISLSHAHDFLVPLPMFGTGITLSAAHTVRLN